MPDGLQPLKRCWLHRRMCKWEWSVCMREYRYSTFLMLSSLAIFCFRYLKTEMPCCWSLGLLPRQIWLAFVCNLQFARNTKVRRIAEGLFAISHCRSGVHGRSGLQFGQILLEIDPLFGGPNILIHEGFFQFPMVRLEAVRALIVVVVA